MELTNIEIDFQQLAIICIILFMEYALVFLIVLVDLVSGIRKARLRNEPIYSDKLKRTTKKLGGYYTPMLGLSVVDCMQFVAIWYLNTYHNWNLPLFPFMTLIGALGVGMIEMKSIFEKAEEKQKFERVAVLAGDVVRNRDDAAALISEIAKYLKENEQKTDN